MTALIFDISSNTAHPIDWAKVRAGGYVGGWIKSTEGATYPGTADPWRAQFPKDYAAAKAAGLVVGPYHWVSPTSAAVDQVANVLRAIGPVYTPGDLLVALDWEQDGDSHAKLHDVRAELHAQGHMTVTYTYPSFWTAHGSPTCAICAADPLWFASYRSSPPAAPLPWKQIDVWQYAGTAVAIPGISGLSDSSRLLVDLSEIRSPGKSAALPTDARGIAVLHPTETLGLFGQHFFGDGIGGANRIMNFYGNRGRCALAGILDKPWAHPSRQIELLIPKSLKP